jgi:act minimal PKS chain-length factor (CLF/KS beta)
LTSAIVTGLGAITPSGTGTEAYWSATLAGNNAIAEISRFDASSYPVGLAGEVRDFDAAESLESRLLPQTDQMTRMALVASDMALADAGVDPAQHDDYKIGVVSSNCSGTGCTATVACSSARRPVDSTRSLRPAGRFASARR